MNRTDFNIDSCEWNFTAIPRDEHGLAEVYEYSRECDEVSAVFTEWLDSEAVVNETWTKIQNGQEVGIETQCKPLKISIRSLLKKAPFPKSINIGNGSVNVDWGDIVDMANQRIDGHPLFRLLPALQGWPKPYLIARESACVRKGINELLKRPTVRKAVVMVADEPDYFDYRFGLKPEHVQRIDLLIDFGRNQGEILADIKEIYNRYKTKRKGRLKVPSSITLKQLGALRLQLRGYGVEKSVKSFSRLMTKLEEVEEKLGHKDHLLPIYASEPGLIAAADKARKRLREYRRYKVPGMFGSSAKEFDFC